MTADYSDPAWEALSYKEKNRVLFERQKKTLEEFLERGAISKAQYEKSLHDLTENMKGSSHHGNYGNNAQQKVDQEIPETAGGEGKA